MTDGDFIAKMQKNFSEHKIKILARKFHTVAEKSWKTNHFTQLWRQWPCLLKV